MSEAFESRVRLNEIGLGLVRTLAPDAGQRAAIARDLSLEDLPRFTAEMKVEPRGRGWAVTGHLVADVVQTCGVTAESLPARLDETFSVDVVAGSAAPDVISAEDAELDIEAIDSLPDVAEDGGIDLARYAVEHLALSLDPFPRKPGAVFEAPDMGPEPSPFAVLAKLRPTGGDER